MTSQTNFNTQGESLVIIVRIVASDDDRHPQVVFSVNCFPTFSSAAAAEGESADVTLLDLLKLPASCSEHEL